MVETELPDAATYGGGRLPPGGVKIRCSLDIADEFTCAWPALLIRHGTNGASGNGGNAANNDDYDDEDDEYEDDYAGGEAVQGESGQVERWRVSAGFGGLILSPVASGEGAAADSSPFLRSAFNDSQFHVHRIKNIYILECCRSLLAL